MRWAAASVGIVLCLWMAGCGGDDAPGGRDAGGGGDTDTGPGPDPDDAGADAGPECESDAECDDGVYCNGDETCTSGVCLEAAAPRDCSDGVDCTFDSCNEEARSCRHAAPDEDDDSHGDAACVDGGGEPLGDDCDDGDATRYPGAMEVCDGNDEDCNPETVGFLDADGDGASSASCCNDGVCGPDCNDGNNAIRPGAADGPPGACDGIDNDCDGTSDEACPCIEGGTRECGSPAAIARRGICRPGMQFCVGGDWTTSCSGEITPSEEICNELDDDCDDMRDEGVQRTYYQDGDGDGFGTRSSMAMACSAPPGYVSLPTDCDDANDARFPGATEICNDTDDDCDGARDEGLLRTFYLDSDRDGYGDATMNVSACEAPPSYVTSSTDCNDRNASANPAAPEVCDGADNDCDGLTDEGLIRTFYRDADGDGFGVTAMAMMACSPPAMHSDRGGDCNDTSAAVNPASSERCNAVDDNCDGAIDTGCMCTDGMTRTCGPATETGACAFGRQTCVGGAWSGCVGAVDVVPEECNDVDDDCDGMIDDGVSVAGCYGDGDGDGYGAGPPTTQCRDAARMSAGFCPAGFTTTSGDCNDSNATVRPMATEICNGADDDCDGMTDEGVTVTGCFADADGDGYGAGLGTTTCRDPGRTAQGFCAVGYTTTGGDCNDGNGSVRPGATETCNGTDDDCDAMVDDGVTATGCFVDADGDTYGTGLGTTQCRDATRMAAGFCPTGYYNRGGDCNDSAATVSPAATESCNGIDDDCDVMRDETFACIQGASRAGTGMYGSCASVSGVYACRADCSGEIFTPSIPPETCNGADDDCDGAPDDTFACVRGATGLGCTTACGTSGSRTCSLTCTLPATCFAAAETCNNCDDDGDGAADDGLACRQGSSMACTTGCGTAGTRLCRADCSGYDACRAAMDVCNGCDDDVDGVPDNGPGLTCERASVRGCMTACGTFGTQACNVSCTGYSTCGAATESCNFCDDDADGTIADEVALATEVGMTRNSTCGLFTFTSATCTDPTARLTDATAAPDFGSMWQNETIPFGYGRVDIYLDIEGAALWPGTGLPDGGFAVLLVDDTGMLLNSTAGTLGVPYDREGLALEWKFSGTRPGMEELDVITLRRLDGTGTGTVLGQVLFNSASMTCGSLCPLDSGAAMSPRLQHMILRYTPDDPRTAAMNEEKLEVLEETGMYVQATFPTPGAGFVPATPLRVGVTAESGTTGRPTSVTVDVRDTRTASAGMCP